jgi:hypothetical protein
MDLLTGQKRYVLHTYHQISWEEEGWVIREYNRVQHNGFNAITMNMGIMDIPTLEPLATALPQLLHENGRCVTVFPARYHYI